jgi:2-C-methyl-D-erythritol 2,4-cyclodiphosphate synthase
MKFRIGNGYDVHRLEEGRNFWLGGIQLPHTHGAVGHLGAANLRDIGYHFSDQDAKYKGIDSKILLKEVVAMLKAKGYAIGNIDTVLCLQAPKIAPYIAQMQTCLAEVMGISPDDISIKATTTEKLGFVGRKEGVEAHAVVLVYQPLDS